MTKKGIAPPAWAVALVRASAPPDESEHILGDLEEEHDRIARTEGERAARAWYWSQAIRSVLPHLRARHAASLESAPRPHRRETVPARLVGDLRDAVRLLRRRPLSSFLMISTLALGLGAATAIFSVVNGVLLEPLPYQEPHRLTTVWSRHTTDATRGNLSGPHLAALRERSDRFEDVAGIWTRFGSLGDGRGDPEQIHIGWVTGTFFDVLGARPQLGRTFRAEEDVENGPPVILLSHDVWQRRYRANPEIVGRTVSFNGESFEVVGVMPEGFRIWMPADARTSDHFGAWLPWQNDYAAMDRSWRLWSAVGRLAPGVEVETAAAELAGLAQKLRAEVPTEDEVGLAFEIEPLHADLIAPVRPGLFATLAAVGLLLLVACANVANLFLAQAGGRSREMALRAALGAGRARIARQLLSENLVLFLLGGLAGLGLAQAGLRILVVLAPATVPRLGEVALDPLALGFAFVVTLGAGLVFGSLPVLHSGTPRLAERLAEGGRSSTGGRRRLRSVLVTSEVALAVVLLVGAGLLLRSFVELRSVDRGFEAEDVLTFQLSLPYTQYSYSEPLPISSFYQELVERLERLPGVQSAALTEGLPLSGMSGSPEPYSYRTAEIALEWGERSADYRSVSTDFFETLGIETVAGRVFTRRDDLAHPTVAVVDDKLARAAWPGQDPIGQQLRASVFIGGESIPTWVEVVGVVEHVRIVALEAEGQEQIYLHHEQSPRRSMTVALRTELPSAALLPQIRSELRALDPGRPIFNIRLLAQNVAAATEKTALLLDLLGIFAVLAGILAAIGVYGVLAHLVSESTREIGVRRACGASTARVVIGILGHGMTLSTGGVLAGLGLALLGSRLLQSVVFGIEVWDPLTFAAVTLAIVCIALLACLVPAVRAGRVDPIVALRGD